MDVFIVMAQVVGGCVLVALVLDFTVFRWIANSHRRQVPEAAWAAAHVNRLRWGFLGTNIYLPFSDTYYLLRVLPRLNDAGIGTDDGAQ